MHYKLEQPIKGTIGTLKYQCTIECVMENLSRTSQPVTAAAMPARPNTLLLSSVATCTLITLRMYIDHKGWDIAEIGVNVNMFQTRKEDKLETIIDRDIKFIQPVTDEQRARLGEIAQACPISKLLEVRSSSGLMFITTVPRESITNIPMGRSRWYGSRRSAVIRPLRHTIAWCLQCERASLGQYAGSVYRGHRAPVQQCPTGALGFFYNKPADNSDQRVPSERKFFVAFSHVNLPFVDNRQFWE